MEIYEDATSKPFGYLLIDLKSDTPDKFRFRTRMTKEELSDSLRKKTRFAPYYYLKK
jgi:hypothetical protein